MTSRWQFAWTPSNRYPARHFCVWCITQVVDRFTTSCYTETICWIIKCCFVIETIIEGRRKEMFYLTTHSTHLICGYMASDILLRTILIARKETRCHHMGYSFRLAARVLLYAPSHRQDSTYHGLCYTRRGTLAGTRNSSMGSSHEGSIRRPIAPWANALTAPRLPLLQKVAKNFS